MKSRLLIFCCALWFCACTAPGQVGVNTPEGAAQSYPPVIEDTPARQQAAQEAWKQFLLDFRLPEAKADLEPLLHTPRALPAELAGRIYLNARSVAFDQMEAKEALRRFLERARILLGADSQLSLRDLSLVSFSDDGSFYRAVYRQSSYSFPIANGYGELQLTVGKNGTLLQWSSRLIPKYDLPARAAVAPQDIAEKLVGRDFSYSSVAGQPMRYRVAQRSEVSVKELVVYPKPDGNRMTLHLAYPVEVGTGTTWTVYVDAINGQELGVKQNFAT
ncbi:MAG: hypothetical protein ACREEM_09630 [Blastocatellia bacterium]